jgi:hypothetical protein
METISLPICNPSSCPGSSRPALQGTPSPGRAPGARRRATLPRAERRREPRLPYPYPIYLTPINPSGVALVDETLIVIGKHLSEHGVDFYHREAIPHRRVIASLDAGDLGWVGLLLELTWCRFTRHGWYDNGGRFLAVVDSPLAADC